MSAAAPGRKDSTGKRRRGEEHSSSRSAQAHRRERDSDRSGSYRASDRGSDRGRAPQDDGEDCDCGTKFTTCTKPHDDDDGHYRITLGESIGELLRDSRPRDRRGDGGKRRRYKMIDELGEGTFGKVVECFDRKAALAKWNEGSDYLMAVKVIKAIHKYREAAKIELDVLTVLGKRDPDESKHCIRLRDHFDFKDHICMVFDLLGVSLYDFMKSNRFKPFQIEEVRHFSVQLLTAVEFIHANKLTHTDLKPENIMISDGTYIETGVSKTFKLVLERTDIQVIDFGSATFDDAYHTSVVSTRHYRAPEVILGIGWAHYCDMWSLGCIMMELYCGVAMFQTHDDVEHQAMMAQILGPMPTSLPARLRRLVNDLRRAIANLRASRDANRDSTRQSIKKKEGTLEKHEDTLAYYYSNDTLRWPERAKDRASEQFVKDNCQPLQNMVKSPSTEARQFVDLIRKLLAYVAEDRISAKDSLRHPFTASFDRKKHIEWLDERMAGMKLDPSHRRVNWRERNQ